MAEILNFKRGGQDAKQPITVSAANKRRLEGLAFVEAEARARLSVEDRERQQRYEIDKITFSMRRALDYIPTSLLRDLADEIATEHELRGR